MEVHAITKLNFFKSNTGNFKSDRSIRAQGSQNVTPQANKQTQENGSKSTAPKLKEISLSMLKPAIGQK